MMRMRRVEVIAQREQSHGTEKATDNGNEKYGSGGIVP